MTLFERLQHFRMGGAVERCHTVQHLGTYSVAEHSWGVAVLMLALWPEDFPRLASYCLVHDIPEAWVGDMPAPVKRVPELKAALQAVESKVLTRLNLPDDSKLGAGDKEKLWACDKLELYFWALEQRWMGNRHAECIINALEGFFESTTLPLEALDLLVQMRTDEPTVLTRVRTI